MIGALLAIVAQVVTTPSRPLTITAAIELARQHNTDIEDARALVEAARASQSAARSIYRPAFQPIFSGSLDGNASANQQYGAALSQRFSTGTRLTASINSSSARNQLGTYYYGETTISLTQSIFGGRDAGRRDLDMAARSVDAAAAHERSVEARVAVDVATACYAIASGRLMSQAAEQAMERYRQLLSVSEAKLAIGQVSQLDVLRAQRLVRQAASRLGDARANEEDARDALRALVGESLSEDVLVVVDPVQPGGAVPVDTAVAGALERSPEVLDARARVAEAEREAADARRPQLPRIDVSIALTRRDVGATVWSSVGSNTFHVVPFVALSLPDRSRQTTGLAADLELAHRQRALRAAELKVELDIRRLARQEARLANDLGDAVEGVSFAERQVDVARERFTRGLSNNLDLVSAETELADAETLRFTTTAALAVVRLQLRAAAGDFGGPSEIRWP